jgi:hypothetical protein
MPIFIRKREIKKEELKKKRLKYAKEIKNLKN